MTTAPPKKTALITGVTGQDGAYLAEFLLRKGYEVHGLKRRTSSSNTDRIDHLSQDPHVSGRSFVLHYGDPSDALDLVRIVQQVQPDEIYHLGAQRRVAVSFETPEYTANCDALGTLRLLEAIRILGLGERTRLCQASTSEMYGKVAETPQTERTPFRPTSPYGAAELYAYWIPVNYREGYGLYAYNGILSNHESPLRGETFVTRKITRPLARIHLGIQDELFLGNLAALRDGGHARDYVEMQWMMLQQPQPDDYVISTGAQRSVREVVDAPARGLGVVPEWGGHGVEAHAVAVDARADSAIRPGQRVVSVDPRYFRPVEVDTLLGDSTKARERLGWTPRTSFDEPVRERMAADLVLARRDTILRDAGYATRRRNE